MKVWAYANHRLLSQFNQLLVVILLYVREPSLTHIILHIMGDYWAFIKSVKCEKVLTQQLWLFSPCMSSRESGTMIDYWPTPGNLALIMSYVNGCWLCFINLEQWTMPYQLIKIAMYKHQHWWYASSFIVGILSFSCHGWSCSMMYLFDQFLIKASDPETQTGFLGQRHSAHAPLVCC